MVLHHFQRRVLLCLLAFSSALLAGENSIIIHSPAPGATLDAMAENSIDYEVTRGPNGDHIHLYVDGKEEAVLRHLKAKYALPTLTAGEHNLCIKMVNKAHTPIGVERCIKVTVQ